MKRLLITISVSVMSVALALPAMGSVPEAPVVTAYETSGMAIPIMAADWQQDDDPTFQWPVPASQEPIDGYSVELDGLPDTVVDTLGTTWTFALGSLTNGVRVFYVRAIDTDGNAGPAGSFEIWVDDLAAPMTSLVARTEDAGDEISPGTWQTDNDPYFEWEAAAQDAPIQGYAYALDNTDSWTSTLATSLQFAPDSLADGEHTFYVRSLDEAGNLSPSASFEIWVVPEPATLFVITAGGLPLLFRRKRN